MSKSANARQVDDDPCDDTDDLNVEGLLVEGEAGEVESEARKLSGLPLEADSASETGGSDAPPSLDAPLDQSALQSHLASGDDDPMGEEARAVERMAYEMELSLSGASVDLTDAVDTLLDVEDEEADDETTDGETSDSETPDDAAAEDSEPDADPDDGTSADDDPDEDDRPKRHHHRGRHHHGKSGKKS